VTGAAHALPGGGVPKPNPKNMNKKDMAPSSHLAKEAQAKAVECMVLPYCRADGFWKAVRAAPMEENPVP
jgi:hypothetical protein